MFREMRRHKQQLTAEECKDMLVRNTSGVLAVHGDMDYPYAVPMSYAYEDGKLYFHWAREGHKLDSVLKDDKVSFCVVDKDSVMPEEYTTYYRSVICFGRMSIIADDAKRREALALIAARYSPEQVEGRRNEVEKGLPRVCMAELTVEHMTGKAAKELVSGAKN